MHKSFVHPGKIKNGNPFSHIKGLPLISVRFRRDNDLAREGVSQGSGLAGYIGEIIYGLSRPDRESISKNNSTDEDIVSCTGARPKCYNRHIRNTEEGDHP